MFLAEMPANGVAPNADANVINQGKSAMTADADTFFSDDVDRGALVPTIISPATWFVKFGNCCNCQRRATGTMIDNTKKQIGVYCTLCAYEKMLEDAKCR